jgi:uncharacterized Fe-S cluster-containing radical SAM superfamily protein
MNYKSNLDKEIKMRIKNIPSPPFENKLSEWWFSDKEIIEANQKELLLTLDMDIGKACDLNCSFCFANTHSKPTKDYINKNNKRIKQIIKEASKLGCKSIKIVGAGEPFIYPGIIKILEYCQELNIVPIIFTGGHIIGDDERAKLIFSQDGIKSGLELAKRLKELNCSVIVKFMTFNPSLQNKLVGAKFDYSSLRDKGLLNLIQVGLNTYKPTRLGVDCLLIKSNYKEAVDLFSFFNKYNIFCVLNTSMDCGKTEFKLANPEVISKEEALNITLDLYKYCIKQGIPFDKRISPYFCSPVCSQLNHGMFIGDDNEVKPCPGGPTLTRYSKGNLKKIWKENTFKKKYKNIIGHECISRAGKTYYKDFEKRVLKKLEINK